MTDIAPFEDLTSIGVGPVTIAATLLTVGHVCPFAGVVTRVTYYSQLAKSGADTNSRTITLYNRGTGGTGTTVVAQLAQVAGVDLVKTTAKTITLSATAANRVVAAGDVLEWESLAVGTGITDSGGRVVVGITRS